MKRYYIDEVKCGFTDSGFACGPVGGNPVTGIKFHTIEDGVESDEVWLYGVEFDDFLYLWDAFDEDGFNLLCNDMSWNEEEAEMVEQNMLEEFGGIRFESKEKGEILDGIYANPENPAAALLKYMMALVRCELKDLDKTIDLGVGHYLDEIDIPKSDLEEDWFEEEEE